MAEQLSGKKAYTRKCGDSHVRLLRRGSRGKQRGRENPRVVSAEAEVGRHINVSVYAHEKVRYEEAGCRKHPDGADQGY